MTPQTVGASRWDDREFAMLRAEQEAEVAARYADLPGASPDRLDPAGALGGWVAAEDGVAVGCAVLTAAADADGYRTGEVKRLYVRPSARGHRVAEGLMAAVEQGARSAGLHRLVLATGPRQPEAIALCRRLGWAPIPHYGGYAATAAVRCFERVLWSDPPAWATGTEPAVTHRRSARALVLDPEGRVLLTHNLIRTTDGSLLEHWALPGGGLEAGETHAGAAARELDEETGLTVVALAGPVVRHDYWVQLDGRLLHQVEELWWGRSEQILVSRAGLQADEDYLVGLRWWPVDELREPSVVTFPRLLADLVRSLLRYGTPIEPFRIVADSTVPPGRPTGP